MNRCFVYRQWGSIYILGVFVYGQWLLLYLYVCFVYGRWAMRYIRASFVCRQKRVKHIWVPIVYSRWRSTCIPTPIVHWQRIRLCRAECIDGGLFSTSGEWDGVVRWMLAILPGAIALGRGCRPWHDSDIHDDGPKWTIRTVICWMNWNEINP